MSIIPQNVLDDYRALVESNSPTREIEEVNNTIDVIKDIFSDVNIGWERIQKGGAADFLVGRSEVVDQSKPVIIFSGHFDTVLPARPFVQDGGVVYGSGVSDMKGGIITMLEVSRRLQSEGKLKNLIIALSPEEEIATPNHNSTIAEIAKDGDYVLVFESNSTEGEKYTDKVWQLTSERKGAIVYTFEITGPGGHSGNVAAKDKRYSTALAAAEVIQAIESLANYDLETTLNPGLINVGEAVNILAQKARITGEARFWTQIERERVIAGLQEIAASISSKVSPQKVKPYKVSHKIVGEFPPLELNETTANFVDMVTEVAQDLDFELTVARQAGSSEANHFRRGSQDIAVLDGFGVWGADEHRDSEMADLRSLRDSIELACAVFKKIIGG